MAARNKRVIVKALRAGRARTQMHFDPCITRRTAAALRVALWGLHLGFTQGLPATLVADTASPELSGTAFGMFTLSGGLALLAPACWRVRSGIFPDRG